MSVEEQLLITLRYFATGSTLQAVGDFHGIHKSTTSKIIKKVSVAIARLARHRIKMPNTLDEKNQVVRQFYQISRFPSCLGAVDCTHIKIQSPGGGEAEIYRNRKNYFSINCQAICDANLVIRDVVCRWPGSAHDSTIFNNSSIKAKFERGDFDDYLLLGDRGYPIKPYLITPLRNPQTAAEQLFNESQVRTRNTIERCFGVLKRRFPILALGIKINLQSVEAVIVATAVLHNIARDINAADPPVDAEIQQAILDNEMENINIERVNMYAPNEARRVSLIRDHFSQLI